MDKNIKNIVILACIVIAIVGYIFVQDITKKKQEELKKTHFILKSESKKLDINLAKKLGLLKAVKLQQKYTWNMAWDDDKIYIISKADKNRDFLEIYDKKSLKLLKNKQLTFNIKSLKDFKSIGVNDKYIYLGSKQHIVYLSKTTLEVEKGYSGGTMVLTGVNNSIDGIREYKNHIIAYGEQNYIQVYKDNHLIHWFNQKANYPPNIEDIKDYWDYNRVNDVIVHKDKLYSVNWRGFINIYDFKTFKFLKQINTIKYEKEYEAIIGNSIQEIAVYQNRYIYFAQAYKGVIILDTKTNKITHIKTLFPKTVKYSKIYKDNIDITKSTDIFQMLFYKDNLIFTEVNNKDNFVYIYSLTQKKIIHTLKGHTADITEMFVDNNRLVGLSHDGYLYEWDLNILKKHEVIKQKDLSKLTIQQLAILAQKLYRQNAYIRDTRYAIKVFDEFSTRPKEKRKAVKGIDVYGYQFKLMKYLNLFKKKEQLNDILKKYNHGVVYSFLFPSLHHPIDIPKQDFSHIRLVDLKQHKNFLLHTHIVASKQKKNKYGVMVSYLDIKIKDTNLIVNMNGKESMVLKNIDKKDGQKIVKLLSDLIIDVRFIEKYFYAENKG